MVVFCKVPNFVFDHVVNIVPRKLESAGFREAVPDGEQLPNCFFYQTQVRLCPTINRGNLLGELSRVIGKVGLDPLSSDSENIANLIHHHPNLHPRALFLGRSFRFPLTNPHRQVLALQLRPDK